VRHLVRESWSQKQRFSAVLRHLVRESLKRLNFVFNILKPEIKGQKFRRMQKVAEKIAETIFH